MQKSWLLYPILVGLGLLLAGAPGLSIWQNITLPKINLQETEQPSQISIAATPSPTAMSAGLLELNGSATETVMYELHHLPQSIVHVLHISAENPLQITPAIASGVDSLDNFAAEGTIAVINGGFFDPVNQKTTSYIVLNGATVADPTENERLVNNPDLLPYLDRILDRSEFRQYQCGQTMQYAIAPHSAPVPTGCQPFSALGAGPQLLPESTLVEEGFAETINGETVRDALGSTQPNARTAIGITDSGDIVLVMAAQLPEAPLNSGLSLLQLADFMQALGVTTALNLDGGSSSSLYYQGQTYYGRVDETGSYIQRPVKSVLRVQRLAGS